MDQVDEHSIHIRLAVNEDIDAVCEVFSAASLIGAAHMFDQEFLADCVRQEVKGLRESTMLSGIQSSKTVYVGEISKRIVAYSEYKRINDDEVKIFALFAHPDVWGTKIATKLMERVLSDSSELGARKVTLWTHEDLKRARRFYEKSGFELTGNRKEDDFGDGKLRVRIEYGNNLNKVSG